MNTASNDVLATDATLLGMECGGTRTVALLATADGQVLERVEAGPANLRLLSDTQLVRQFRALRRRLGMPAAIGAGMAGARSAADRARASRLLAQVWPRVPAWVGHDLDTALAAAGGLPALARRAAPGARIIVVAGTGSCTYGQNRTGQSAKVGGWGHLLGDRGSGYDISFTALRRIIEDYDRFGEWSELAAAILGALQLNDPEDLIEWVQAASKPEIAALAPVVFACASTSRDARDVLDDGAMVLAADAVMCAQRLGCRRRPVEFILTGSLFRFQQTHVRRFKRWVRGIRRSVQDQFAVLTRESAWGAVEMARAALVAAAESAPSPASAQHSRHAPLTPASTVELPRATASSPTEQRNPRSMKLDRLTLGAAIELFLDEDATIAGAVRTQRDPIRRLIQAVVKSMRAGGRLFYVGAGTSGRLGVLDASECPPTFRTPPERVQGIIAGGATALWRSIEGAEDDPEAGARAMAFRKVAEGDVVVGIAASGRTPFVWGALAEARRRGALTALLCCNPHLRFSRAIKPDIVIAPDLGPEILTGSTRLKSGTATKLILNMVTTLTMVRLGKVISNLMVDLNPSNTKLRDRAARIVMELTGRDRATATAALVANRWLVQDAIRKLGRVRQLAGPMTKSFGTVDDSSGCANGCQS